MEYDKTAHRLLRDIAHRARLTPEEYPEFEDAVRAAGIAIEPVAVPEWPPVPYSPLLILFGDAAWWEGRYWTGEQPVVSRWRASDARRIAREIAGDGLSPPRLAYAWQCPEFDEREHIILRYWLEEHDLSIVDFLVSYLPQVKTPTGRDDLLVDVANPRAQQESAEGGGYSPTRRAVRVGDRAILDDFAAKYERFNYDTDLQVSWVRSADDSRWECRRTHAPQSGTMASHRSWVMRPLGSGATSDDDVNGDGYRFGPAMELFDDGMLWVWVARRALDHVSEVTINGVRVGLTAETFGVCCRMVGHIAPERMAQVVGEVFGTPDVPTVSRETAASDGPIDIEVRFHTKSPFHNAVSQLPEQFHRPNGRALVLREPDRVRVWGDEEIVQRGLIVNGVQCRDFVPWNRGWQGHIDASVARVAAAGAPDPTDPEERVELATVQSPTEGARTYSPNAVVDAIEQHLGRDVRLFGQAASDSGIVCLTRAGLRRFLDEDATDRIDYITDNGGRNYDCENFSETLRVNLARKYGVNGCAVIWGDGHAWCIFPVVGSPGPAIVMIEPQGDNHVQIQDLTGNYSVERRAEVLL